MSSVDGVRADGYDVLELIGRGGSSRVYRARQRTFARDVALKVLTVDKVTSEVRERFGREALALGPLSVHPNIVTVLDAGVTDHGEPFLALELYEHGSYGDRLQQGPIEVGETVRTAMKVAAALQAAHEQGMVHKDIKPDNILISRFGEPALADFGVASFIGRETTAISGFTVRYAAPEVLEDEPVTELSDIYSLGVTMYALLTGAPPFDATSMAAVLQQIATAEPAPIVRPDVPDELTDLIARCLAKNPARRPPSAAAVLDELRVVERRLASTQGGERRGERTGDPDARGSIGGSDATVLRGRSDETVHRGVSGPPPLVRPVARPRRRNLLALGVLIALACGAIATVLLHDPRQPATRPEDSTTSSRTSVVLPPTDVRISRRGETLIVSWNPEPDVTYEYTVSVDGGNERSTGSTVKPEVDLGPGIAGKRQCISVTAIASNGGRSQPAPTVCG